MGAKQTVVHNGKGASGTEKSNSQMSMEQLPNPDLLLDVSRLLEFNMSKTKLRCGSSEPENLGVINVKKMKGR